VTMTLKTPFPYFGGKRAAASIVWERLGDVDNYIEPFAGSAAMLLCRPHEPKVETINDADCYVANFWRATKHDPEAVADHADGPVNECDLHARHRWLVQSPAAADFRERMRADPEYFDAKVAGWWCWGLCCWIGSGWCAMPESRAIPRLAGGKKTETTRYAGLMLHADKIPNRDGLSGGNRPQLGDAFARGRGVHGCDQAETCADRRAWLLNWFGRLRDRLRTVRVCCGDWLRICNSDTTTTRLGLTGVFLDPPYSTEAGRNMTLYSVESGTVAHEVRTFCLERGPDPLMRICLAGYAGEGHEELESTGWSVVAWKGGGGYGNRTDKGKENTAKERLWFSPHCVDAERRSMPLFDGLTI
jgi:DNA adenine methylase